MLALLVRQLGLEVACQPRNLLRGQLLHALANAAATGNADAFLGSTKVPGAADLPELLTCVLPGQFLALNARHANSLAARKV